MNMSDKQQLMLYLLGIEKKGSLSDFDEYAVRKGLNLGKSVSVARMLDWYGKEAHIPKLRNMTGAKVLKTASFVSSVFSSLDMMECTCMSPFTPGYPNALLSMTDINGHVINPPFLFCKGRTELLADLQLAIVGSGMANKDTEICIVRLMEELKAAGRTVMIPLNMPGSTTLVKMSLDCDVLPVLLVAGGIEEYLNDFGGPYLNELLSVMDADGLIVSVHLPDVKVNEQLKVKTLLYLAGFVKNVMVSRIVQRGYESTVLLLAHGNGMRVFVPDNAFVTGEVRPAGDIVYIKKNMKLCGLLR